MPSDALKILKTLLQYQHAFFESDCHQVERVTGGSFLSTQLLFRQTHINAVKI